MRLTRRHSLLAAAALAAPGIASAQGQWSPNRPVRLVVGFTPAGTTDIAARIITEPLSQRLGQQVIVENRPGAGGNLGADLVAKADPDGHTILMQTISSGAINYQLYGQRMPYKPEDLVGISLVTRVPNAIFVHPGVQANTLGELVELAKRNPGRMNIGSSGVGTSLHMTGELLKLATGIDLLHVPFRGAGPMLQEMIAGRIQVGVDNLPSVVNHLREGRLRPLAVTTKTRSPAMPEVPTTEEAGLPSVEATAWFGLVGPARMPREAILRINRECEAVLADPAVWRRFEELGGMRADLAPGGGSTPETFDTFIRNEVAKWSDVVRRSGATVEG
ncbi:Bug family tripartite tricarboxylate transporter substrate binding protein [Sabulicella rubraurantiaca]|uniref:Bug family tripartite tricarboxylate transporter substrate binding protein n=1 Tax=Sabulicella rubraurantiaca TaxID=2811429 RepID=UPI001A95D41D|nr:tripartite tricarboxylate transporter substrate binding protein [Sabulicella rubraurantiaca]